MAYSLGAVERAMKVQEVILRAVDGQLTWLQAADILGRSPRSIRRLRWKLERFGYEGLFDRRRHTPSPKRAPLAEIQHLLALYRDRYQGFNVRHFHQLARRQHGVRFCYAFVKTALETAAWSPNSVPAVAIAGAASPARASASCCTSMAAAISGSPWCPSCGSP